MTIPASVITIGADAFAGVTVSSLTWNARECWTNGGLTTSGINQVIIGNEVTVLPARFVMNSSISSVDLPGSLVTIGDYAFNGCRSLASLTIPVNVSNIGEYAFNNTGISSLTWNARECWSIGKKQSWGKYLDLTEVTIGNEVEVLPAYFVANSRITSVNIPNSVKYIGDYAFYECDSLTRIVVPDGVQNIGRYAISYCDHLTELVIGKGVKGMGEEALTGTWALTTLTWNPKHCETSGMMTWCENLSQLTIGDEVEVIPRNFLYYSKIKSLVYGKFTQT